MPTQDPKMQPEEQTTHGQPSVQEQPSAPEHSSIQTTHGVTFGQLVFRRFVRNKLAIAGFFALLIMILFCFVGTLLNPYREYEQFFDPDVSFSVQQLSEMKDLNLISEKIKVTPIKMGAVSSILGTAKEVAGEPIALTEVLKNPSSTETFRLYHTSFRLAQKNILLEKGFCTGEEIKLYNKMPITGQHLLGTDVDGFDVFTRLQYGGRVSLLVGLICMLFAVFLGAVLGGIAGYYGGFLDGAIMRIVDVINSIPVFPIIILFNSFMRFSKVGDQMKIYYLIIIIAALNWTGLARLVRGQILSLREQEFMLATETVGLRAGRRIFRHLLPNVMPQIIVNATLLVGGVILLESALSFLGLGVSPPYSTWGIMINRVNDPLVMIHCPYIWLPPGLCILLTIMAINFVGDGLRDAFDPKMKR
ncbi:hypothetical protein FACS1894111_07290 [Clostridia bacterium]|nr:hypothetical protein FACS1894111_07290 [Clostridia bacterium]